MKKLPAMSPVDLIQVNRTWIELRISILLELGYMQGVEQTGHILKDAKDADSNYSRGGARSITIKSTSN